MFYDLNLRWPIVLQSASSVSASLKKAAAKEKKAAGPSAPVAAPSAASQLTTRQRTDLETLLKDAIELGFQTIAFNFLVKSRFDGTVHRDGAFWRDGVLAPPFADLDARLVGTAAHEARITQLSRLTLVMDDDSMGKHGHGFTATNQGALSAYDLLAAQPYNDASFSHVCLSMTELKACSVDIISLDFSASGRPAFFLRRSLVNAAIASGAVFEVCYAPIVHSSTSSTDDGATSTSSSKARRNIIAATRDLLRTTNGRGVILSSGASDVLGLRGPYDVINLAAVLGMNPTAARDAISSTCRALVLRAETRKSFRGVVGTATLVQAVSEDKAGQGRKSSDAAKAVPPPPKKRKQDAAVAASTDGQQSKGKKRKQEHTPS